MFQKIHENSLRNLYLHKQLSAAEIAKLYRCSVGKINYWLDKFSIRKRTISEAVYKKHNPHGDPFSIRNPKTIKEAILYGVGLGLYWGEGTKANTHSVRLGNTDPKLIKTFLKFLKDCYAIEESKLRFGLQIFSDMPPREALNFWVKVLQVNKNQFQKIIVTGAQSIGTYRHKTKHGVLTVYFHNKKLRNLLYHTIEKL